MKWIVLSIQHPDLTARILLAAGIKVIEANTETVNVGMGDVYPITVEGDRDDVDEVIEQNMQYFATYFDPVTWQKILSGDLIIK